MLSSYSSKNCIIHIWGVFSLASHHSGEGEDVYNILTKLNFFSDLVTDMFTLLMCGNTSKSPLR